MNRLSILLRVYKVLVNEAIEKNGLLHSDTIKLSQRLDLIIVEKQLQNSKL